MRIDADTTQQELERLFSAVARRDFLLGTPLNVKRFLCDGVLFALFPCMRLGFLVGCTVLCVFAAILITLLSCGQQDLAGEATKLWLLCGGCVWFYVTFTRFSTAWRRWKESMSPRTADASAVGAPTAVTNHLELTRIQTSHKNSCVSTNLCIAEPGGIVALLVEKQGKEGAPELSDRVGVCRVHTHRSGEVSQTLLLLRLSPGKHILKWICSGEEADCTAVRVQLLCAPDRKR